MDLTVAALMALKVNQKDRKTLHGIRETQAHFQLERGDGSADLLRFRLGHPRHVRI
jgi:hypothetical protein